MSNGDICPDMEEASCLSEAEPEVRRCYQCKKCTNGCPLTFAMDLMPHQIIRLVQLGQKDQVMGTKTIWVCSSCQTCTTRCPNEIDIAHVMDGMRQICLKEGHPISEPRVAQFHEAFLDAVKSRGRIHELEMVLRYKAKTKDLFQDAKLGTKMFLRGKIKPLGHSIQDKQDVKRFFRRGEDQ